MERLAESILLQAIKDWENTKYQPEIREFLASEWFATLVEIAGFDRCQAASIRIQLEAGMYNRVGIRAAYR